VVAYGDPGALAGCLDTLGGHYPVVVVDNSSTAATRDVAIGAGAQYLDPGENLGFAAAVNVGLRVVGLPDVDVLLLNPDARIQPEDIERLRDVLAEDHAAVCVAPSYRVPGSAREATPWWPWITPAKAWAEAIGVHRVASGKGFLSGAVLVVRGKALFDVGPFDERFFLYAEDQDWQRRALARGWQLRHCPQATAEHLVGGTESDIVRLQLRLHSSLERYLRKWYKRRGWFVYRTGVLLGQSVRWLAHSITRRRPEARRIAARLCRMYMAGPDRTALRTGAVPLRDKPVGSQAR